MKLDDRQVSSITMRSQLKVSKSAIINKKQYKKPTNYRKTTTTITTITTITTQNQQHHQQQYIPDRRKHSGERGVGELESRVGHLRRQFERHREIIARP
jgi:hypothetical protein